MQAGLLFVLRLAEYLADSSIYLLDIIQSPGRVQFGAA